MKFPDYIYDHIIQLIVNHLFNKNTNLEVFYYKQVNSYKVNEVVILSLVNKKFFQFVSSALEGVLNYKNYKSLKRLIALPPKINNNNNNNNNSSSSSSNINNKKRKYIEIQDDQEDNSNDNNQQIGIENGNQNDEEYSFNDYDSDEDNLEEYQEDEEDQEDDSSGDDSSSSDNSSDNSIDNSSDNSNNNNNNINYNNKNHFKLIQNHNLVKVYSSVSDYFNHKDNSLNTSKVLIEPFGVNVKSISILNGKKKIEPHCEVDLWLSFDDMEGGEELEAFIESDQFKSIPNKVNLIYIRKSDDDQPAHELLDKIINTLNPKKVEYYRNEMINTHSILFQNNSLESLEFSNYYNFSDPYDVALINNQKTKLKSLSISCLFNSMTRYLNNCRNMPDIELDDNEDMVEGFDVCDYYKVLKESALNDYKQIKQQLTINDQDDSDGDDEGYDKVLNLFDLKIKKEWDSMFQVLSNNSTIRDLVLSDPCCYLNCRTKCIKNYPVDKSYIASGLATIFSSPVSKIENLVLDGLDYNDSVFLSSLANNKTIHTLLLFSMDNITPFFYKVLPNNKTIRNVFVARIIKINYLQLLLSITGLELYSLTIRVHKNDDIFGLLNSLLDKNNNHSPSIANINIKELTIYTSNYYLLQTKRLKSRYILNNNCSTIINILYIFDDYPFSSSFK